MSPGYILMLETVIELKLIIHDIRKNNTAALLTKKNYLYRLMYRASVMTAFTSLTAKGTAA